MSDYTPDTDDIKRAYQEQCNDYYADCEIKPKEHANEFDRWLAEHDAEVARAERESIAGLLKAHVYNQSIYLCSCQNDDDYPNTMDVDGWAEHVALIKGENE